MAAPTPGPGSGPTIKAKISLSDAEELVQSLTQAFQQAMRNAAQADLNLVNTTNTVAANRGLAGRITEPREFEPFVRKHILQAAGMGTQPVTEENLQRATRGSPHYAPLLEASAARSRAHGQAKELQDSVRTAREEERAARGTYAGQFEIANRNIAPRYMREDAVRQAQDEEERSPRGYQRRLETLHRQTQRSAEGSLVMGAFRGNARKEAAQKLGITLPEDMSTFARALQTTIKTATSVGMLEALSGGSAAPLARALAQHVIAGALTPAMTTMFGGGGAQTGPKTITDFMRQRFGAGLGQSGAPITDTIAVEEGAGTPAATTAESGVIATNSGEVGATTTGTGTGTGGGGSSGAASTNTAAAVAAAMQAAGTGNTQGLATDVADQGSTTLNSFLGKLPGPVGGLAKMLVSGVGLAATAGVGGALFLNAKNSEINGIDQQLLAAATGKQPANGYNMMQGILGVQQMFPYSPSVIAGVQKSLLDQGINTGQGLISNTENALSLSTLTGADPTAMGNLVGALGTKGGASADEITKMVELMATQNQLTKDQGVSMDSMVGSLQTLVQQTGGIPVNAGTVASLSAISHTMAQTGAAGRNFNAGQLMSGVMGATGVSELNTAALLGLTPTQFQAMRNPKNKTGMAQLFDRAIKQGNQQTAGMNAAEGQALRETYYGMVFGQSYSSLGTAQQEAIANLSGTNAGTEAATILAKGTPLSGNTFKKATGVVRQAQVSAYDQALLTAERGVLSGVMALNSTSENIYHILQSLTSTVQVSANKAAGGTGAGTGSGSGGGNTGGAGGTPFSPPPGGAPYKPTPGEIQAGGINDMLQGNASNVSIQGAKLSNMLLAQYKLAGKKSGIPWQVLVAQGFKESTWNPNALAPDGGQGIAQFMPKTWAAESAQSGIQGSPYDPSVAIPMQAFYLHQLLVQKGGNMAAALTAYNAGASATGKGLAQGQAYAASVQSLVGQETGTVPLPGPGGTSSVTVPGMAGGTITIILEDRTKGGVSAKKKAKGSL